MNEQHPGERSNKTPSYEQMLTEQHGSEAVSEARVEARATPGLGDTAQALKVGAEAPDFTLSDTTGTLISLTQLLTQGPAVIIFYRGGWCPFCNVYLRALQMTRLKFRALNANVVLISPQRTEPTQALRKQHGLLFPLLSDRGNEVARRYGLVFQMPEQFREAYLADDTDLAAINGDPSWEVPMPATFVVAQDGTIRYAFVSADYTMRAEPQAILDVLQQIKRRSPPLSR